MKITFFSCLLFAVTFCYGDLQAQTSEGVTHESITYSAEIPDSDSYEITKNTLKQNISEDILLRINLHRRAHENYLWVLDENIEILIYKF